jgi:hypothetical protein
MQPSCADRKAIASALNRTVRAVTESPFYVFAANAQCFGMAGSFSVKHFHLVVEMDQVATLQHHFLSCTLLPSCTTFLRLLRPILRFAAKMFQLALESSQLLVVHWQGLEFPVLVKNWLCVVQRVHKLVLHPCGVARLSFVLVPLLSRNGIFKNLRMRPLNASFPTTSPNAK